MGSKERKVLILSSDSVHKWTRIVSEVKPNIRKFEFFLFEINIEWKILLPEREGTE